MRSTQGAFESHSVTANHFHVGPMMQRQTARFDSCLTIRPKNKPEQNAGDECRLRFAASASLRFRFPCSRRVGRREETERFEDRKMGRPSSEIIFLSLIFLSIAECRGRPGRRPCSFVASSEANQAAPANPAHAILFHSLAMCPLSRSAKSIETWDSRTPIVVSMARN